jgi:hypothetical protein
MPIRILYESEGFAKTVPNGTGQLDVSWSELLHAAITVGRPNRQDVFAHGASSNYEAIFRWSLIRMALEQNGPRGTRLLRTDAFRTLDPSEKGAVSYFLGLVVAKLFASKLLNAPWLMHLDVYRPRLNPVLKGRSRPDLVGQTKSGDWIALECKGRLSKPGATAKDKAKEQARRVISVGGAVPIHAIGAITYFVGDSLQFFWRDPEPDPKTKYPIRIERDDACWRHYYRPALDLLRAHRADRSDGALSYIEHADLKIGIHPAVLGELAAERWADAKRIANGLNDRGVYGADGIALVAGESWSERFKEYDLRG